MAIDEKTVENLLLYLEGEIKEIKDSEVTRDNLDEEEKWYIY